MTTPSASPASRPTKVRAPRAWATIPGLAAALPAHGVAGWLARSAAALLVVAATIVPALGQQPPLTQLQFDIVGLRLQVDPPALTVPKGIATQINTSIVAPGGATPQTQDAIAALTAAAFVEGELRGPAIPPTPFQVRPGQPIPVPALALPGDYFLDNVRLVKDGQALLDATAPDGRNATTIPIRVINEILVTSVTSRPLSLDEIREKGIVIDEANFKAVNFQVAFNIDGTPFRIELPVAMPTPELLKAPGTSRAQVITALASLNQQLASSLTKLPDQFDRPGLNFSIAALPFIPVLEELEEPGFDVPPVTGLIVIPGNVAFLNQFFSVILTVGNVAPDGTPLVLRDVTGTIALPNGLDRVPGSYDQPGDDPLRLARIEGIGIQPTIVVAQVGADGKVGTADDIPFIPPQKSGDGEFLVEGLKEGGHVFDIQIDAVLDGLPNGPVRLTGKAAGVVFVRNPTFSVTLAHPRTVRSGERYEVYATVYNTSQSDANLVSVNLDPAGLSGTQLVSAPTVSFETLRAGQSALAKFTFVSQQTGEVTASSFTGEAGGGIQLTTGVGERGIPLSPNAIVLPTSTNALPSSLVAAAQRVLGQAFSIATAPAEALPPGVLFVRRNTVVTRGQELGEAGQRIEFGEVPERVIKDLLLDWLGNRTLDEGFDQLLRGTEAGRAFLDEIGLALGTPLVSALDLQAAFGESTVSRAPHLSVMAQSSAGAAAVRVRIVKDGAATTGESSAGIAQDIATGAFLGIGAGAAGAELALAGVPQPARYRLEATALSAGTVDVGALLPGATDGTLRQLRLGGVALAAGGFVRLDVDLSVPGGAPVVAIDADGDGIADAAPAPDQRTFTDGPPSMLAVRQLVSSFGDQAGGFYDPATYGLLVAALFDRPVTEASAERVANYAIDNNAVIGAQLQQSGRLAFLYLQKPVGGIVPRSLTASGIVATRGGLLPATTLPIAGGSTDGGRVFGQARRADGRGVAGALIELTMVAGLKSFTVARIPADANGAYDFEFVPRVGDYFVLRAQDPQTRDVASVNARVRGAGEQLLVHVTFTGSGTVRGRVVAADGVTPVTGVPVALIPGGVGERGFAGTTDALGEFTFTDVPVGPFAVRSADRTGAFGSANGVIASAGDTVGILVVANSRSDTLGRLVGRVFLADGATPAAGFAVYAGTYDRQRSTIAAVDQAVTDGTGSFAFTADLPQQSYDVVAVDPATRQTGVTRASVIARTTTSVVIVLEATGSVEGVVFSATGQPVAGALVAGGVALVATDANGFFRIEGVPAGARTVQAGDPVTRRRGDARIDVVPGQTVRAQITLEARATITGRVLDADGHPVPKATVRIPSGDGYTVVIANNQGVYTFPDLPLGNYLIQAPGPSEEALEGLLAANGYGLCSAYTSGDCPEAPSTPPSTGDPGGLIRAYQEAVKAFFSVNEDQFTALPIADLGGFGWTRVQLFQDAVTETVDVRFLSQGTASGRTEDSAGRPTGALVRVRALKVDPKGFPVFFELERKQSDAATGAFTFSGIARYDETTFQRAGVRGGEFTLEAAQQFSPTIAQFRGQLSAATPNLSGIVLRFPPATETNGTVSGRVVLPDGITAAPAGTVVKISFGDLQVTTTADGRFESLLPVPAGSYVLTAQTPTGGLRGRTTAVIPPGGSVDVEIRLLGLGAVHVVATRPGGLAVQNATVRLERGTFPSDRADGGTDANGEVRFTNLTEGPFSVVVEEQITGLTGRASGTVVRDGEVTAHVVITASGRVTGSFVTAATGQVIPFAQVTLRTAQGVQAFASTDAAGRFDLPAIPVGAFTISAFDPASGRTGLGAGQLSSEGQTVDVRVVQVPRGTVTGRVLNGDGATTVAGARVTLTQSPARYQATTLADGTFRFEGISQGAFAVEAVDPLSGFPGSASGRITIEGEVAEVNVTLLPFGAVVATVRDENDAIVPNATVTLVGRDVSRQGAVDSSGVVTFENLPLDTPVRAVARSLAVPQNGGSATATLTAPNQRLDVAVRLRGTAPLTVAVVDANGTPVASARVTADIDGLPGTGGDADFATSLVGFTLASGSITFPAVPLGDVSVKAEGGPLAGIASGVVSQPGAGVSLTAQIGASAAIAGRVVLPDGATPAVQALVTLRFQTQTTLQPGTQQFRAGVDGRFAFDNIPLGTFSVNAFEVVTNGVRQAAGTLTAQGQLLDLGDLVLDNASPLITAVVPADNATDVAPTAQVSVTFDEPVAPSSVSSGGTDANLVLLAGTARVAGTLQFSDGNRTVTFVPAQPLASAARYTLSTKGAPDGPKDESGLVLQTAFVSGFTVRDIVPPVISSIYPAPNATQVVPEAVVRVTFSEPVATASLSLRDGGGQPVAGTVALTLGNTVAVFSPTQFLPPNASYTLTVSGAVDLAGNALAGAPASASFATVDTLAPVIAALQLAGNPRAGTTVTVTPQIAATDVQRVEFTIDGVAPAVATAAPFATSFVVPAGRSQTAVAAVAVDLVGNRSAAVALPIAIVANQPPAVSLVNVDNVTLVGQGETVAFDVVATDDEGVASIRFTAGGAASLISDRPIAGTPASTTQRFTVTVPPGAPSAGTLNVQAAAFDGAGLPSTPASLSLPLRDGQRPTVTIVSPAAGTQVAPGGSVALVVDAADDLALASIQVACTPATLTGCESRALSGTAWRQTFTLGVPGSLTAPLELSLVVSATDAAGNTGTAGRTLALTDTVPPVVTSLVMVSGATRVLEGETVAIRATVTDNVALQSVAFTASSGAFSTSQTVPVTGPSGEATFNLAVPSGLGVGAQIAVTATARDAANVTSPASSLALTVGDIAPPTVTVTTETGGLDMAPGQPVRLIVTARDEVGVTRITLSGTGAFTFNDAKAFSPPLAEAQAAFTVNVPATVQHGQTLTVTARSVDQAGNVSAPAALTLTALVVANVMLPPSALLLAGDVAAATVQVPAAAPSGGLRIDLVSANTTVATVPVSVIVPEGATSAGFDISGVAGGTTTLKARIDDVVRASMAVTVRGGVVRGRVVDQTFTPVAGVRVTAAGSATVVTDTLADGTFLVEGVTAGADQTITVRAFDAASARLCVATGSYAIANGFLALADIVLLEAGAITGAVVQADAASTPAGAGVRVDLFRASGSQPGELLATTFTGADSRFAFDLVSLGNYVLEASDVAGNRGRLGTGVAASGTTVDVTVRYLGRGAVLGTVRTAGGAAVPNASLTLSSTSLFGWASRTATAAADGTFRFEGVFVGTFSLQAVDPVSQAIGGVSGAVALHQEEVSADVSLTPFSNLRGTVFRADGVTPAGAGVDVTLNRCNGNTYSGCNVVTVTNELGQYRYDFLPLVQNAIVVARDPATRSVGRGAIALNVNGATLTLDITFQPQGTLVVLVTDANATPQPAAAVTVDATGTGVTDQLTATTGPDGTVVIERVLTGTAAVSASAGGLSGSTSTTLSGGEVKNVTVALQPTATITGRVFLPNGQSPAVDGRVVVTRETTRFTETSITLTPEADGVYRAEGLPLTSYVVRVFDAANQLRGIARNVALASNTQVVTLDFTLVGIGTVSGRVVNPDGSAASGIGVVVSSLVAEFGLSRSVSADGGGNYVATGMPVGGVLATAQTASLIGDARGQLTADGQTLTLDILLESNAVTLPTTLADGNQSPYTVMGSGRLEGGFNSVYYGDGSANRGSANLAIVRDGTSETFAGSAFGTYENQRREIAIRQDALQGLSVVRKVFVPATGYFTRHLELLANPTAQDITVDVRVVSNYRAVQCCSVNLVATGSGDRTVAPADRWVVLDDFSDADAQYTYNSPPVAYVLSGAGAAAAPQAVTYQDFGNRVAQLAITWQQVTVPAGQTVGLMHFVSQQVNQASARASAQRLELMPPEALEGLSAGELAAIRNFVVPADGVGTVEPLPALTGTVTGTVFEGDGTTTVQDATLDLVSSSPYFRRRRQFTSTKGGAFSVTGLAGGALPIPIAPFTITATHPGSGNAGPATPGTFAEGATTASVNVLFSNLGWLAGTVRRANGVVAPDVRIVMQSTSGSYIAERTTGANGLFRFAGVTPGTVVLAGEQYDPQGTGIKTPPIQVQVLAGQGRTSELTLEQAGSLLITVVSASGVPVPNAYVDWERDNYQFSRYGYTDANGRLESSFMPVGTFDLRAFDPTGSVPTRTTFSIALDQQTVVNVQLLRLGTVTVTVLRANGQPAASTSVQLFNNDVSRSATTNVNGNASLSNVPFDQVMTLRATNSQNSALRTEVPFTLTDTTSTATVTMPPYGQIGGTATLANGGLILSRCVVTLSATGFSRSPCTNASGQFSADGVPVGIPVTVRVNHPTVSGVFKNTVVTLAEDGQVISQAFATAAQGTARLTARQSDGMPLAGVRVETRTTTSPTAFTFRGTTNSSGVIDLASIPEGVFTVRIRNSANTLTLGQRDFEFLAGSDGQTVDYTYQLQSFTGTATGALFLEDGTTPALTPIVVRATAADGSVVTSATVSNGTYTLSNLVQPEGGLTLVALWSRDGEIRSAQQALMFTASGESVTRDFTLPLVLGTVRGRVTAAADGAPVAGTTVSLATAAFSSIASPQLTDADGRYAFTDVVMARTRFRVTLYMNGLVSGQIAVTDRVLDEARTAVVDFVVDGYVVRLTGTVTATDLVTPISGAPVYLQLPCAVQPESCSEGQTHFNTVGRGTNGAGVFEFPVVAVTAGTRLQVRSPSRNDNVLVVPFTVEATNTTKVVDIVFPITVVTGVVSFGGGAPVPYPNVFATTAVGTISRSYSEQTGRYRLYDVPVGPMTLTAQDYESGLTRTVEASVTQADQVLTIDVALPPSATVEVSAIAPTGAPLSEFCAGIDSAGLAYSQTNCETAGTVTFENVPLGPAYVQTQYYDSNLGRYQYASVVADVTATPSPFPVTTDYRAASRAALDVTVLGREATPIEDASVWLRPFGSTGPLGSDSRYLSTDVNGQASVADLPPGPFRAEVEGHDPADGEYTHAVVSGVLHAGQTTAATARLGTAIDDGLDLIGDDQFAYRIDFYQGAIYRQENPNGVPAVFDSAMETYGEDNYFGGTAYAEADESRRSLIVGPSFEEGLLFTRRVYSPQAGGFVRFHDEFTNVLPYERTVTIRLRHQMEDDGIFSLDSTASPTTLTFVSGESQTTAVAGFVLGGLGSPVKASQFELPGESEADDRAEYAYVVRVPAFGTIGLLHFAAQRAPEDLAALQRQLRALADLSHPNALTGLTAPQRAAIRNFVIP